MTRVSSGISGSITAAFHRCQRLCILEALHLRFVESSQEDIRLSRQEMPMDLRGTYAAWWEDMQLQDLDAFRDGFGRAFNNAGMTGFQFVPVQQRQSLPFARLPGRDNQQGLKQQDQAIITVLEKAKAAKVDFVVLFVPSRNPDLHDSIKRAGDQHVGIANICHVTEDKRKPSAPLKPKADLGTLANNSMKINLKANPLGANQALHQPGPILTAHSVVIGIDVTHPGSSAMKDAPSIATVVGSIDSNFAQWPAILDSQMPRDDACNSRKKKKSVEEVLNLRQMVHERILIFCKRNNGHMPDKIVVYRDGLLEE
jgi:hypothetical protein